jgi:trigger factor
MASVQVETVDAVRRRLVIEIPARDVTQEFDRAFNQLSQTANIRGFRRGRVPRAVLERMAGDQLRAEVFERLVHDSFLDALRGENIEAVGSPEITTESAAQSGQPLRYSATVEVKPEVEVGRYDDIAVERPRRVIGDDDVEGYLEQARQAAARIEPIADRDVAQADDIATVDYTARVDDRLIGKGDDRLVRVGGDDRLELGWHLNGVAIGATTEFTVAYPEDFANADLAGKTVSFSATVKALGERHVPPVDDDFAKAYGGFENLEQMRTRVRAELEAHAEHAADSAARSALIESLLREHEFEVPQGMVDRRADGLVSEFLSNMGARRPPASQEREVRERLRQEMEPRARQQVRANLLLEAIARVEGIDVGEDEIAAAVEHQAGLAGASAGQLRSLYDDPSARMGLRLQMLRERALDRVLEKANVRTLDEKSSVAGSPGNG